jgi:hypothetical protein
MKWYKYGSKSDDIIESLIGHKACTVLVKRGDDNLRYNTSSLISE